MILASGTPFATTYAGALTLALVSVIGAVAGSYWLVTRSERTLRNQTILLLANAIAPENRPGLVQRVETVESNLNTVTREFELHGITSAQQRQELLASMADLRSYLERELTDIRGQAA